MTITPARTPSLNLTQDPAVTDNGLYIVDIFFDEPIKVWSRVRVSVRGKVRVKVRITG